MNQIQYTGTGSASGTKTAASAALTVTQSTTYILSGYIDATNVSSGSPQWSVMNTALTTTYGSVSQTAGVKGRVTGSISIPSAVTSVVIVATTNNCTVTTGQLLVWAAPQLEQNTTSGSATAYKPNTFDDTTGKIAYGAHAAQVQAAIQSTADGHGSYITHGTIYQEHISGMTGTGNVNLDGLPDGTTYARVKATSLTSGSVDLSLSGVLNRTLANISDDSSSSRYAVSSIDAARKALIDFSQAGHTNKTLDNINDGSTYARVKATELASGTVKQLNDGTYTRTAAQVANVVASSASNGSYLALGTVSVTQLQANAVYMKNLAGDTSGDTSTLIMNGSTKTFLQSVHDATVLLGSVTGYQKNMCPDSDLKWGAAYWTAGSGMSIVVAG